MYEKIEQNNPGCSVDMNYINKHYPGLYAFLNTEDPNEFPKLLESLEKGLKAYKINEFTNHGPICREISDYGTYTGRFERRSEFQADARLIDLISICCITGRPEHLKYLSGLPEGRLWLAKYGDEAFAWACRYGQLSVVNYLFSKFGVLQEDHIRLVAEYGHTELLKRLFKLDPGIKKYFNSYGGLLLIEHVACHGHIDTLRWLLQQGIGLSYLPSHYPVESGNRVINSIINEPVHFAFNLLGILGPETVDILWTAARGNKELFETMLQLPEINQTIDIEKYCTDKLKDIFQYDAQERGWYITCWDSTRRDGHQSLLESLLKFADLEEVKKIKIKDVGWLFDKYSRKNYVKHIIDLFPDIKQEVITDCQWLLTPMIKHGNREMIDLLLETVSDEKNTGKRLVNALRVPFSKYHPDNERCKHNCSMNIILFLLDFPEITKHVQEDMAVLSNLISSNCTAQDFQTLLEKHTWLKQLNKYLLLERAVSHGNESLVKLLLEYPEVKRLIRRDDYSVVQQTMFNDLPRNIRLYFLGFPEFLSYAEQHWQERHFREGVDYFIENEFLAIKRRKNTFEKNHLNATFDISSAKVPQYFLMIRNWIRRYGTQYLAKIRELLTIPALRMAACHTFGQEEPGNELLRLAIRIGNTEAMSVLLDVPEVCHLARQNNYYVAEFSGEEMPEALINENESSMLALSRQEQERLDALEKKYAKKIEEQSGTRKVFENFLKTLEECYLKNPARASCSNEMIDLPLSFEKFQELKFASEKEKSEALKAYYQHPVHTCWRYFQKPNLWMHPNATYVEHLPNFPEQKYASFELYIPLIALLWTATSDESLDTVENCTTSERKELFIRDIALINRAHNWDKYREVEGKYGNYLKEYFEDLEGDRPSCYSGVKRRLFEALKFYPFSSKEKKLLTREIVSHELRDFVRDFYLNQQRFRKEASQINEDVETILCDDDEETSKLLLELNLPEKDQMLFVFGLCNKYGLETVNHVRWIENEFKPKKSGAHLCLFYNDVEDSLKNQIKINPLKEKINLAILGRTEVTDAEKDLANQDENSDSYLKWMNANAAGTRGISRFSHWFHGDSGKDRARNLLKIVNRTNVTHEELLKALKDVFAKSSNTEHSLRNYLKKQGITEDLIRDPLEENNENENACWKFFC